MVEVVDNERVVVPRESLIGFVQEVHHGRRGLIEVFDVEGEDQGALEALIIGDVHADC